MIATSFDRTMHLYTVASIFRSIATARVRQKLMTTTMVKFTGLKL
jgi:hypothetical protein